MINRILYKKLIYLVLSYCICVYIFGEDIKEIGKTYEVYGLFRITVPSNMELQGGKYKFEKGKILKLINQSDTESIIFNQIGLNSMTKEAYSTYARVLIDISDYEDDIGPILSDIDIPKSDLEVLNSVYLESTKNNLKTTNNTLLEWYGVKLLQKKGYSSLMFSYLRKYDDNKPVYVECHNMFFKKKWITITISCRQEEIKTEYSNLFQLIDGLVF
jgi:hypothetical protein